MVFITQQPDESSPRPERCSSYRGIRVKILSPALHRLASIVAIAAAVFALAAPAALHAQTTWDDRTAQISSGNNHNVGIPHNGSSFLLITSSGSGTYWRSAVGTSNWTFSSLPSLPTSYFTYGIACGNGVTVLTGVKNTLHTTSTANPVTSNDPDTASFVVNLSATATAPSAFVASLIDAGVPANQRGPSDDPDGDGLSNLLEFALGGVPLVPDSDKLPVSEIIDGELTLTYVRAQPSAVTYEVITTTDLGNAASWPTAGVTQGTPDGLGGTTATIPYTTGPRFLRLRVALNP